MKKPNERTPPQQLTLTISSGLASAIFDGAAASGLTPEQYVLSVLWHNVPLAAKSPAGIPACVQLVLNDIQNHYLK